MATHVRLMMAEYLNANVEQGNRSSFLITGEIQINSNKASRFEQVDMAIQAVQTASGKIFYYDRFQHPFTPALFARINRTVWNIAKIVLSNPDKFPEYKDLEPTNPTSLRGKRIFIKKLPPLRKGYSMLAPAVSPDGKYMVIQGGNAKESKYGLFELFLTEKDTKVREINILDDYVFVGHPFLAGSEGDLFFSAIEDELLDLGELTSDDFDDPEARKADLSKAKKADIWHTRFRRGLWNDPQKLKPPVNTRFSELTPSLSPDGKYLFFASNRPGGQGGFDLWKVDWQNGSKAKALNLGPKINSPYDELFPVMHYDSQTFTFSSNRPGGLGGYDIYKVNFADNPHAENIGSPINTKENDFLHSIPIETNSAFISRGKLGSEQVYWINMLPEALRIQDSIISKLHFFDADTNQRIAATVRIIEKNYIFETNYNPDNKVSSVMKGKILNPFFQQKGLEIVLRRPAEYQLSVSSDGYRPLKTTLKLASRNPNDSIVKIFLSRDKDALVKVEEPILKPNIPKEIPVVTPLSLPVVSMNKPEQEKHLPKESVPVEKEKSNDTKTVKAKARKYYVYFPFNSALLSRAERRKLARLPIRSNSLVTIGGHSDRKGTPRIKRQIAGLRAKMVYWYLKKKFPKAKYRIRNFADRHPLNRKVLRKNRRAVIFIEKID